jgi:hypothetical protein
MASSNRSAKGAVIGNILTTFACYSTATLTIVDRTRGRGNGGGITAGRSSCPPGSGWRGGCPDAASCRRRGACRGSGGGVFDDPAATVKICENQTYALCAVASCFVFDGLSYCKCDVKSGDSISLPFDYGRNQDVCTANAEGRKNGYMISTYSLPESVVAPGGDQAL